MADNESSRMAHSDSAHASKSHSEENTQRKRKFAGDSRSSQGRGADARDRGSAKSGRYKNGNMGRKEFQRQNRGDRKKNNDDWEKTDRRTTRPLIVEDGKESVLPAPFSQEDVASEERRPKHKVAVMIGYSGTGYHGMQINASEKTIEGDLFTAFVAAGAISKANANDPRKSSLVRCARTDKGVHAAGNVISLKLIIEDAEIVKKINQNLSPQIRVWGIERTTGGFSSYHACDSRWYEYLIPTHTFLPAHPASVMAKRLVELADKAGDRQGYEERQAECSTFWQEVEEQDIKPILDSLEPSIRARVSEALYNSDSADNVGEATEGGSSTPLDTEVKGAAGAPDSSEINTATMQAEDKALEMAVRRLKQAYQAAKRRYRISPERLARIQPTLDKFLGTKNFHNYTINKEFKDPSAKRVIKSFKVNPEPKVIGGTEWLSIKIHGQSFMMHQIRKMIGMVSLVVRSGSSLARIEESFGEGKCSIPKLPGLGLLLESPVFTAYNEGQAAKYERAKLDFKRYRAEMEEFKEREIYQRIFREEEETHAFDTFFAHIDQYRDSTFLYLSSMGAAAAGKQSRRADESGDSEAEEQEDGG